MLISNRLKLTLFSIIVVIGLLASHAGAKSFGHGRPSRHFGGGLAGLKSFIELNLSENQKTEALSIIEKYQYQKENAREKLRDARENLRNTLKSESLDENSIRTAYRLVSSLQEDLLVLRMQMRAEIEAILTPEQTELLKEKKEQRFAKMKNRLENRLERFSQTH